MITRTLQIAHLAETEALGRRLGEVLFPGAVVALIGPLGAGKTHLVRAIAEGLGILNSRVVNSPTFVLCQEYNARLPIAHFDAYRLKNAHEFADLGVWEYFEGDGVTLIEWADRVADVLPADHLEIVIHPIDIDQRQFVLSAQGMRYQALLESLVPA